MAFEVVSRDPPIAGENPSPSAEDDNMRCYVRALDDTETFSLAIPALTCRRVVPDCCES
jgi:hypothetical protein